MNAAVEALDPRCGGLGRPVTIRGLELGRVHRLCMPHLATENYGATRLAPVLSVNDAARVLGVERSTIYRLLRTGELQAVRVGKRKRFRPEDLDAYLERGREPSP